MIREFIIITRFLSVAILFITLFFWIWTDIEYVDLVFKIIVSCILTLLLTMFIEQLTS